MMATQVSRKCSHGDISLFYPVAGHILPGCLLYLARPLLFRRIISRIAGPQPERSRIAGPQPDQKSNYCCIFIHIVV